VSSLVLSSGKLFLNVDETIAEKMLHTDNIPKDPFVYRVLDPIIGKRSIITASGDFWKILRKLFNPGFSPSYLQTLLPKIVEEAMEFVNILESAAQEKGGQVLEMGPLLAVAPCSKFVSDGRI